MTKVVPIPALHCDLHIPDICDDKSITSRLNGEINYKSTARNICVKCFIYTWKNPVVTDIRKVRLQTSRLQESYQKVS
jgi:hypothetical protein